MLAYIALSIIRFHFFELNRNASTYLRARRAGQTVDIAVQFSATKRFQCDYPDERMI